MRIRFWGTRGSIATPGTGTNRFGGNTSCVEVETKAGGRLIFDCGTGARLLGQHWMEDMSHLMQASIFLSHTHWDHIQGFPFFGPLFVSGNSFRVCGPQGCHKSLPDVLSGQMEYTYFPVELGQLGAKIDYQDLVEGANDVDGLRVFAQFLNHPATTLGYRVETDGVSMAYLCDHEPFWEPLWRSDAEPGTIDAILHGGDRRHAAFMQSADVVIHDAQYTPDEYPAKRNWGHSTYAYVTKIAAAAGVKRLFLTHHDPGHDDEFLCTVEALSREIVKSLGSSMEVSCAYEGCEEMFERDAADPGRLTEVLMSEAACACSLRILVVDDDEGVRQQARRTLLKSGHRVLEATNGAEALALIERRKPDMVILDLNIPAPDGIEVLRFLRSQESTASLPVLALTSSRDENSTRTSFELKATDFLNKPFTPPQLDARVNSCYARSQAAGAR
jgi:CheY-like chemotaxis protein/phosphoribosyl 1,2-cyclic phosphodiesterase